MNLAIAGLPSKQRNSILKSESRHRASGDWGVWEHLEPPDFERVLAQRTGWVRHVHTVHRNRVFSVFERLDKSGVIHAGVSSLSGIRPTWYEMQRIKNELFGYDRTGIEVYPHRTAKSLMVPICFTCGYWPNRYRSACGNCEWLKSGGMKSEDASPSGDGACLRKQFGLV